MGDLYVLLSKRADTLRSFPGDTSLPGGKADPDDPTLEYTARREAFEEIGLPIDRHKVPLLCVLEPFLAGNYLLVTPVVVLITDISLRPVLNAPEVESLFAHPLYSILQNASPHTDVDKDTSLEYHTFNDIHWTESPVRMHRFLTGREDEGVKPIYGLTSAILIRVATLGYGREPDYEVMAPGQLSMVTRIDAAMRSQPRLQQAARDEGLVEWLPDEEKILGHRGDHRQHRRRRARMKPTSRL